MIGIGIDTGGTYTDAVIYDTETREIFAAAKAQTTHEDLKIGIENVLMKFPKDMLAKCKLAALSTTLATNACVENKGGRGKLIFIGIDEVTFKEAHVEYGIDRPEDIYLLPCHIGADPANDTEPDWDIFRQDMTTFVKNSDCISIVQLFAKSRSGAFEKKAAQILQEVSDIPVIMGHELFPELNAFRRGAGALLNAHLVPVIYEFLTAIRHVFELHALTMPTVIVRSDGSLMNEQFALKRPVETLLCGPAASIIGARTLADAKDALIVDIGGTTTDIAMIENGEARRAEEGIQIGQWKTFVKGLYVETFGLGGDTAVHYDSHGKLFLENDRVVPLCTLAAKYPVVLDELKALVKQGQPHTLPIYEYYCLVRMPRIEADYTEAERALCMALKDRPLSVRKAAEIMHKDLYNMDTSRLEKEGIIIRSGLTPTDMMHILGDFNTFCSEAPKTAAAFVMLCTGHESVEALAKDVYNLVIKKLYCGLVKMLLFTKHPTLAGKMPDAQVISMIESSYEVRKAAIAAGEMPYFDAGFTTKAKLIGVGAPTHIFIHEVARLLGTEAIVPEYAHVANAVGAISGQIRATEVVEIIPSYEGLEGTGYRIYTSDSQDFCVEYKDALAKAKMLAKTRATAKALAQGASKNLTYTENLERHDSHAGYGNLWLSEQVTVTASGAIDIITGHHFK